jgi:hypothetical protein
MPPAAVVATIAVPPIVVVWPSASVWLLYTTTGELPAAGAGDGVLCWVGLEAGLLCREVLGDGAGAGCVLGVGAGAGLLCGEGAGREGDGAGCCCWAPGGASPVMTCVVVRYLTLVFCSGCGWLAVVDMSSVDVADAAVEAVAQS